MLVRKSLNIQLRRAFVQDNELWCFEESCPLATDFQSLIFGSVLRKFFRVSDRVILRKVRLKSAQSPPKGDPPQAFRSARGTRTLLCGRLGLLCASVGILCLSLVLLKHLPIDHAVVFKLDLPEPCAAADKTHEKS